MKDKDLVLGYLYDCHKEILEANVDWGQLVLDSIEAIEALSRDIEHLREKLDFYESRYPITTGEQK